MASTGAFPCKLISASHSSRPETHSAPPPVYLLNFKYPWRIHLTLATSGSRNRTGGSESFRPLTSCPLKKSTITVCASFTPLPFIRVSEPPPGLPLLLCAPPYNMPAARPSPTTRPRRRRLRDRSGSRQRAKSPSHASTRMRPPNRAQCQRSLASYPDG